MYDELWTAGKCMYKLRAGAGDGGELIIYAPHLKKSASATANISRPSATIAAITF